MGAVLEQEQENGKNDPILYVSCRLSKHEGKYGLTELETRGVVWAIMHYRAYLWDHQYTMFWLQWFVMVMTIIY